MNNRNPDFSGVQGGSRSTETSKPDFSDVRSRVDSTEAIRGGEGGGGGLGGQTYTVAKGDTLSHIAREAYGNAGHWQAIYEANRDQLDDPDRIYPGQVLRIPVIAQP